jgi:hypothetical protein
VPGNLLPEGDINLIRVSKRAGKIVMPQIGSKFNAGRLQGGGEALDIPGAIVRPKEPLRASAIAR